MSVTPYQDQSKTKKEQVSEMFDNIASSYDFLNHFLSLGIDILWRKKAIRLLKKELTDVSNTHILDVATGTGDLAVEATKIKPRKVTGLDLSPGMLEIGKQKMNDKGLDHMVDMIVGDSENLPFEDETFDGITVAFGVRNFENLKKGLGDMRRVLKTGSTAVIMEFSKPKGFPFKQLFNLYFFYILPAFGKLFSKDNRAYKYLPESVQAFPEGNEMINILHEVGYTKAKYIPLTMGICSIYLAKK